MSTWLNVLDYNKSLANGLAEGGYTGVGIPVVMGGTGATTASAAFNALSPMTTGGDLIYGGASGAGTRLANGTAGQVLTSAGTTVAPTWATPASSGVTSVAQTVPSFLSIAGSPITTTGTLAISYSGTALPLANGGTALTSHVTAATASTFTSWDANANLSAANFLPGYQAITSSASLVTFTVSSPAISNVTGTVAQTVQLPVASTLVLGQSFQVLNNNSTGSVTVNSSGSNAVGIILPGTRLNFMCVLTSGTTAASWTVL